MASHPTGRDNGRLEGCLEATATHHLNPDLSLIYSHHQGKMPCGTKGQLIPQGSADRTCSEGSCQNSVAGHASGLPAMLFLVFPFENIKLFLTGSFSSLSYRPKTDDKFQIASRAASVVLPFLCLPPSLRNKTINLFMILKTRCKPNSAQF